MSKNDSKYTYVINQDLVDKADQLEGRREEQTLRDKKYKVLDRMIYNEELPKFGFDVRCSLAPSLSEFGETKTFDGIGDYVRFTGEAFINNGDEPPIDMAGVVGQIASKANDRIIMLTDKGFFGWINPNEYEKLVVIESHINYVN